MKKGFGAGVCLAVAIVLFVMGARKANALGGSNGFSENGFSENGFSENGFSENGTLLGAQKAKPTGMHIEGARAVNGRLVVLQ